MSLQPARVLILDDDPKLSELMGEYLRTRGHSVLIVPDGAAALAQLHEQSFDALIAQQRMPKVGGLELLAGLAGLGHPVAPVLLTPFADVEGVSAALQRGARAVVRLPLRLSELHDRLLEAIQWHRKTQDLVPLTPLERLIHAASTVTPESCGPLLSQLCHLATTHADAALLLIDEPGLGMVPLFGSGPFPVADPLAQRDGLLALPIPLEGPAGRGRAELLVASLSSLSPTPPRMLASACSVVGGALSRLCWTDPWSPPQAVGPGWQGSLPARHHPLADPRLSQDHTHLRLWWRLRTEGMRWLPPAPRDQAAAELRQRFPNAEDFLQSLSA